VDIRLYLDLGGLVAPVLNWQEWGALAEQTRTALKPLAEEAEQRHLGPAMQAMAKAPTWANDASLDSPPSGPEDMTADGVRP